MKPTERERQIRQILRHFNFARVQRVMAALDYTFAGHEDPTIEEIQSWAQTVLRNISLDARCCGGAGLYAYWARPGKLGLRFTVDDWEAL